MRRSPRLGRHGNAIIEFAMVGPVFILAVIVLFETGTQLLVGAMLDYGVRLSSRWGVTGAAPPPGMTREDRIRGTILDASGGFLQSARLTLTLESYGGWSNVGPRTGATAGAGTAGQVVTYRAVYTQPLMTTFASALLGQNAIQHRVAALVNNEPYPAP